MKIGVYAVMLSLIASNVQCLLEDVDKDDIQELQDIINKKYFDIASSILNMALYNMHNDMWSVLEVLAGEMKDIRAESSAIGDILAPILLPFQITIVEGVQQRCEIVKKSIQSLQNSRNKRKSLKAKLTVIEKAIEYISDIRERLLLELSEYDGEDDEFSNELSTHIKEMFNSVGLMMKISFIKILYQVLTASYIKYYDDGHLIHYLASLVDGSLMARKKGLIFFTNEDAEDIHRRMRRGVDTALEKILIDATMLKPALSDVNYDFFYILYKITDGYGDSFLD